MKVFALLIYYSETENRKQKRNNKRNLIFPPRFSNNYSFSPILFTPHRDLAWHIACVTCQPKISPPFFIYISLIAVIPSDSLTSTVYVSLSPPKSETVTEKNGGKKRVTAAKRWCT